MPKNRAVDYRVNFLGNGKITGIEIKCCENHIGEIRFRDGESTKCATCGTTHSLCIEHNHFHLRQFKEE